MAYNHFIKIWCTIKSISCPESKRCFMFLIIFMYHFLYQLLYNDIIRVKITLIMKIIYRTTFRSTGRIGSDLMHHLGNGRGGRTWPHWRIILFGIIFVLLKHIKYSFQFLPQLLEEKYVFLLTGNQEWGWGANFLDVLECGEFENTNFSVQNLLPSTSLGNYWPIDLKFQYVIEEGAE